jgi:hypothetical protein
MSTGLGAGLASLLFSLPLAARVQSEAGTTKTADARIAEIRSLLGEIVIETRALQRDLPLGRVLLTLQALQILEGVQGRLPRGKAVALRIDKEALGKRYEEIAQTPVRFPPFPRRISLSTALRIALSKLEGADVDYRIWPTHLTITTPERALYTRRHDIWDLAPQGKRLLKELRRMQAFRLAPGTDLPDTRPGDGPALLIRLILSETNVASEGSGHSVGSVQVLNGRTLSIHTNEARHEEVANLLEGFRRLLDVAVVMKPRLYEVDRPFYIKHIAPLLVDRNGRLVRRMAAVDEALVRMLQRKTLVLKGDDLKIPMWEPAVFLSLQTPFRYHALPGNRTGGGPVQYRTGLAGVSFQVDPVVSTDRRCLRLKVRQDVTQLVGIARSRVPDLASEAEVEVESPNLRKSSLTDTLEIEDGHALVMPVEYRPPGMGKDRLWVMLAHPTIYIEEEEAQIRKGNLTPIPTEPAEKEEAPKGPTELPGSTDVKEILQAVVTDLLTSKDLEEARADRGKPGDNTFALVDGTSVGWPKTLRPSVAGYRLVERPSPYEFDVPRPRLLGISLDEFPADLKKAARGEAPIVVGLGNAGGSAGGPPSGWISLSYVLRREGKRWVVKRADADLP